MRILLYSTAQCFVPVHRINGKRQAMPNLTAPEYHKHPKYQNLCHVKGYSKPAHHVSSSNRIYLAVYGEKLTP